MDTSLEPHLVLQFHGSMVESVVLMLCHIYAMQCIELSLSAGIRNPPWRAEQGQDFFAWRKVRVARRDDLLGTLVPLFGMYPPDVPKIEWSLFDGLPAYDAKLARHHAEDYARGCVKALGFDHVGKGEKA